MQEAWQQYVRHSLRECPVCQSVDGSPCGTAEALYAAYQALGNAALDQMSSGPSLP